MKSTPIKALWIAAGLLSLSASLNAQEQEAPQIDLGLPSVAAPTPSQSTPEVAPPAPEAIDLNQGGAEAPAPGSADAPLASPITRDGGASVETADAIWRLPLLPLDIHIPGKVQVGPSFSEPGILRLTGEQAETTLNLLQPETSAPATEIHLTLQTSVNVLNDTAIMLVTVNEAAPIEVPLMARLSFTDVVVPTDALHAGENRIHLSLRQPHRIFCGPDATFGVWTEIDLARSGVDIDQNAIPLTTLGFRMAIRSQIASGRDLTVLADDSTDQAVVRHVANQIARVLGGQSSIEVRSPYLPSQRRFAAVAVIPSDQTQVGFRRSRNGGVVLQVEFAPGDMPDLADILAEFPFAAASNLSLLDPGRPVALSELGMADVVGKTHYFRYDQQFSLPSQWLLLADQKAELNLHYGFAAGLPEGATMLVKINDETVRLLPLDREGGKLMPPLAVGFNANLLHAGRNSVSFEMIVPGVPADEVCAVQKTSMLVVKSDTTLTIPNSPGMAIPGLNIQLLGLQASAIMAPDVATDKAILDRAALRVAASFGVAPRASDTVSLTVLGLADLSTLPLDKLGIGLRKFQEALFPVPGAVALAQEPAPPSKSSAKVTPAVVEDPLLRPTEFEALSGNETSLTDSISARISREFSSEGRVAREISGIFDRAFLGSSKSFSEWLSDKTGVALLVRPDSQERGQMYLVLGRGAEADEIGFALRNLRDDGLARGEAALLQEDGTWQIWSPIRAPILVDQISLSNLRVVLGNYASWSPALFTLSLLAFALISAIPALLYVVLSRRGRDSR